jgi:putative tryptophan/tyrosine transport system substrate-binding protein
MNRREVITLLGGAAVGWPISVGAQQPPKVWRIGFLGGASRPNSFESSYYGAFLKRMHELGYVETKDFVMEWRFADGNYDRLLGLATELVQLKVDIIVTTLTLGAKAAQQATTTIPIVMAYSNDPVGNGVIASINRPGGNVTGLASSADDTTPKQLELLATVVPNLSRISVLMNPANFKTHAPMLKAAQISADILGLVALTAEARNLQELDAAFVEMTKQRAGAMMVIADSFFFLRQQRIAELALGARLPTMFPNRDYVEAGGLMSYGNSLAEFLRQAATYVDRIFKGAKPAELPVEQPTKFLLVVNLKTAKALGLEIPSKLLALADEVIE